MMDTLERLEQIMASANKHAKDIKKHRDELHQLSYLLDSTSRSTHALYDDAMCVFAKTKRLLGDTKTNAPGRTRTMQQQQPTVKPCPFCGGEAELCGDDNPRHGALPPLWGVRCVVETCIGYDIALRYPDREAAAENWNRRANEEGQK